MITHVSALSTVIAEQQYFFDIRTETTQARLVRDPRLLLVFRLSTNMDKDL